MQQQQNCRDQRAGMANADPPDETGNGKTPGDGDIDAPNADAVANEIGNDTQKDE